MQLIATDTDYVVVEHNGQQIRWSSKMFDKKRLCSSTGIFTDINGYFQTLHPAVQEQIWVIYTEIHQLLLQPAAITHTVRGLQDLIAKLYQSIEFDGVEHYVKFYCNVFIPETVKDSHSVEEVNIDRTYLKQDFIRLVALTVMLRPMVPIWGEFIKEMSGTIGILQKDLVAFRLLCKTNFYATDVVERLKGYIQAHIAQETMPSSVIIFSTLSSDQIPEWMMSMIVVRRMVISQISSNTGEVGSLISNIYGYLKNCLRDIETRHSAIREKHSEGGDEETERSLNEDTRVREALTPGDLQTIEYHARDILHMAQEMDAMVPEDVVMAFASIKHQVLNISMTSQSHQIVMAAWMVRSIPPLSLFTLDKTHATNVIVAVQSVLWHWGMRELALLITASPISNETDNYSVGSGRSVKIRPELVELLEQQYPYAMSDQGNYVKTNFACNDIMALSREITNRAWSVAVPSGFEKQVESLVDSRSKVMLAPHNLPDFLAEMVIRSNQGV